MEKVKLAIIYYSTRGTNYQLAKWAEEAAVEMGAEVRVLRVEELAPKVAIDGDARWKAHVDDAKDVLIATDEDLQWADGYIFSMPTRFGNVPSQMKQFLDTKGAIWAQGKINNKVVSAMTSAGNLHGGQEATIRNFYTTMMHWGAIIVPPGYTDDSIYKAGGNPYGTSVTVDQDFNMIEDVEEAVKYQARRTLIVTKAIVDGIKG